MTKHAKELQRYYAKWILIFLLFVTVTVGLYGAIFGLKDSHLLLIMLGEIATLLAIFFGFNMMNKVSEDTQFHKPEENSH